MRILIKNGIVISMDKNHQVEEMSVLIEDELIRAVFASEEQIPDELLGDTELEIIDAGGMAVLPGFINGHIHADMLLTRGLGDGLSLHEQGSKESLPGRNNWFKDQLSSSNRMLGREIQYIEALRTGTTYICDFLFWVDSNDDICSPFRTTGINGAVVIDYRKDFMFPERRDSDELSCLLNSIREAGCDSMLQGPSEEDFETKLLLDLKSIVESKDVKLMLHLAETRLRCEMIMESFGKTPVSYLNDIGFLGSEVIGSHGIYINENEAEMLASTGTTIVNSPVAEMKIADGAAPVRMLLDKGVAVGLGTDGPLWNDASNMFGEMKTLMLLQRLINGPGAFSAWDALEAATIGGARALGLESRLGSIEEGKEASIIILDLMKPNLVPSYKGISGNLIENIVSSAQPSDIDTVFVKGKKIICNGSFVDIDEKMMIKEAQILGEKLFSDLV